MIKDMQQKRQLQQQQQQQQAERPGLLLEIVHAGVQAGEERAEKVAFTYSVKSSLADTSASVVSILFYLDLVLRHGGGTAAAAPGFFVPILSCASTKIGLEIALFLTRFSYYLNSGEIMKVYESNCTQYPHPVQS